MYRWLPDLRSTDFNGPRLYSAFSILAGQRIAETTLGVKGSQVQILSSRQCRRSLLAWAFTQAKRLLSFSDSISLMIHWGGRWGPCGDHTA
jgi:hypothetical protein